MKTQKPTKSGVKAALHSLGYFESMPDALKDFQASNSFTVEDMLFAQYLIWDTDFGGAWNDAEQINQHTA